jgi:hypothetical protein
MLLYVLVRLLILAALIVVARWLVRILTRNSSFAVKFLVAFLLSGLLGLALARFGIPIPISAASAAAMLAIALWGTFTGGARVRTEWLEARQDRNGAVTSGRVLEGQFAGAELDDLDEAQLDALLRELAADPDARRLVYDYIARRFGVRNPTSLADARAARDQEKASEMSRADALSVLGLEEDAQENDIIAAYERLIGSARPDNGGSAFLAGQIERARAVLLDEKS